MVGPGCDLRVAPSPVRHAGQAGQRRKGQSSGKTARAASADLPLIVCRALPAPAGAPLGLLRASKRAGGMGTSHPGMSLTGRSLSSSSPAVAAARTERCRGRAHIKAVGDRCRDWRVRRSVRGPGGSAAPAVKARLSSGTKHHLGKRTGTESARDLEFGTAGRTPRYRLHRSRRRKGRDNAGEFMLIHKTLDRVAGRRIYRDLKHHPRVHRTGADLLRRRHFRLS